MVLVTAWQWHGYSTILKYPILSLTSPTNFVAPLPEWQWNHQVCCGWKVWYFYPSHLVVISNMFLSHASSDTTELTTSISLIDDRVEVLIFFFFGSIQFDRNYLLIYMRYTTYVINHTNSAKEYFRLHSHYHVFPEKHVFSLCDDYAETRELSSFVANYGTAGCRYDNRAVPPLKLKFTRALGLMHTCNVDITYIHKQNYLIFDNNVI